MEDSRARIEQDRNKQAALKPGEWNGPDAGYLRNREGLRKNTEALCDRLAAAAKERGRPLTHTELEIVGRGEELPPVVKKDREKTLGDLEVTVRALTERLEALEQAQKSSTPVHLAKVERR